jgi:hypothetical protein
MLNTRLRSLLAICLAVSSFAAGFAVSARDLSGMSWQNLCLSRCEQRYQSCIASGKLAPSVCESNYQACTAACSI